MIQLLRSLVLLLLFTGNVLAAEEAFTQAAFDRLQQQDIVKAFKAIKQSTLIIFKGGKEVDRSLGVTNEQAIEALMRKAL